MNRIRWILAMIALLFCVMAALEPRVYGETLSPVISGHLGKVAVEAIIRESEIRIEIDLTNEQYAGFRQLQSDFVTRRQEISRQTRGLVEEGRSNEEITRILQLELDKNTASLAPQVKEILKPGQYARLEQIVLQKQIRSIGVHYLQASPIANAIDLTTAELAEWRSILDREHQRFSDHRHSLFKEHADAIASLLAPEQRAAFEKIHGESFREKGGSLSELEYDEEYKVLEWGPVLDLLRFADVRKEVEMIDDQYAQVRPLLERYSDEYRTLARKLLLRRNEADIQAEFRRTVLDMQHEATQRIEKEVLLPHQVARLHQLIFQAKLGRYAPTPLLSPLVAKSISLTKSQQAEILNTMRRHSVESKQRRAKLLDDALKNCIDALTPEQQARYHRLVGKKFEQE